MTDCQAKPIFYSRWLRTEDQMLSRLIAALLTLTSSAVAQVSVAVLPDNGVHADTTLRLAFSTNDTVRFRVVNTSPLTAPDVRFQMTCARSGNVTAITSCLPGNPIIAPGDTTVVTVVFTVGAVGTGRVQLTATYTTPPGATATGGWDITIVGLTQVSPKDSLATVTASSSGNRAVFYVKNNRPISGNYSFLKVCNGAAASCTGPTPTPLTIAAGATDSTVVIYSGTAAVGDTGRVRLIATVSGVPPDTGAIRVLVTNAMAAPVVDVASYNPGRAVPRSECLTIDMGEGAAMECGDLRVTHSLPMFKTFNVERRPALLYNSATAISAPQVAVKVQIPSLTQLPDTIEVTLRVGASVRGRQRWVGGPWGTQGVPRFIRVRDTTSPATGLIDYAIDVVSRRKGGSSITTTIASQPVLVVNRTTSPYGNGWWVAGLEQLLIKATDTLVWIGGDGSAKVYSRPFGSGGAWVAPSVTYTDNIVTVGASYVRLLPDSVWVSFGSSGRHESTRNRQGHITQMTYDGSGRLSTISLPTTGPTFARGYSFAYGSSYYIVTDGGFRPQTTIWLTGGKVDSIVGVRAPLDLVSFGYVPATNLINRRTDRRLVDRRFDLDAYGKVRASRLGPNGATPFDPTDSIIVKSLPSEALGFSTVGSSDSVGFHTSLDGPRRPPPAIGGVFDTTAFWLNRFGAPVRIVNALGDSIRVDRTNSTFPGLITGLKSLTGQIMLASYDARGRILSTTDSSFALATTQYQWDTKWDQITRLIPPENDSLFFTINPSNGDRTSRRSVRVGDTVNFSYDPVTRQVNLITGPGTSFQGFSYDGFGDVSIIGTQAGYQQRFVQDFAGRTTILREQQIDLGATKWLQTAIAYDLLDRDSLTVTKVSTAPTDSQVIVRKYFDLQNNLDSLSRRYKTPGGSETLTTSWVRDGAGRPFYERAPDGNAESYKYDSASNDTSAVTRRGDVISMRYDALNRLVSHVVPQYVYPPRPAGIAPPSGPLGNYSYTTPRSVDSMEYTADGRVRLALNRFSSVDRQYNSSGLLLSETLSILASDTTLSYGSHVYLTKYEYDRNRRRVSLVVPRLFRTTTDTMRFSYYPWGAPYQTQDVNNLLSAYLYNTRGELSEIIYPGSIVHDFTYNQDGHFARDNLINLLAVSSPGFPRVPNRNLRDQAFTSYDARGKLLASSDTTQYQDQVAATYANLGYLAKTVQSQKGINGITGGPTTYTATDSLVTDALGNLIQMIENASGNWGPGGGSFGVFRSTTYGFQSGTGRLIRGVNGIGYVYDGAGQAIFDSTIAFGTSVSERASFFGAGGELMAVDQRVSGHRVFEEYRYDALGRRIWVRTRVTCAPNNQVDCALSRVRRTVWDQEQELAEIQVPDTVGAVENDSSRITVPPLVLGGFADPNPFFGRVLYTPGWRVDQPLSMTRFGYNDIPTPASSPDTTWSSFVIFPHWDTRGVPTLGTFGDGAVFHPKGTVAGQTQCPAPYSDATNKRCVFVTWVGGYSAYDQRRGLPTMYSWHGTLLENKRDPSGFEYKRDRMYDPNAGRFTQEDPIGLGGGLNLYGFGNGDPMSFSDPFGLRICFAAPNGNVRRIVRTIEQATDTRLTLEDNCLTRADQVKIGTRKGFSGLQAALLDLIVSGDMYGFVDGDNPLLASTDALTRRIATLDFVRLAARVQYLINISGTCQLAPAGRYRDYHTPANSAAHEMGHMVEKTFTPPAGEPLTYRSMVFENWYHVATGEELRCRYQ